RLSPPDVRGLARVAVTSEPSSRVAIEQRPDTFPDLLRARRAARPDGAPDGVAPSTIPDAGEPSGAPVAERCRLLPALRERDRGDDGEARDPSPEHQPPPRPHRIARERGYERTHRRPA